MNQDDLTGKTGQQKERILKAASDVFLAAGFERTSTAEIARLAKVSKRELYLHFADKRDLLAAVVEDLQSDIGNRMDSLWASTKPLEEVLLNSAKVVQAFILSERFGKLMRIVIAESYHSPNIGRQFFAMGPGAGSRATARYLKEQMKLGNLRKANPGKAADDFLDLVISAQLLTAVILGQTTPGSCKPADARHAVEVFLMIYNPDAPKLTVKPRRAPRNRTGRIPHTTLTQTLTQTQRPSRRPGRSLREDLRPRSRPLCPHPFRAEAQP